RPPLVRPLGDGAPRRLARRRRRRARGRRGRRRGPRPRGAPADVRPGHDRGHGHGRDRARRTRRPRKVPAVTDGAVPEIRPWSGEHAADSAVTVWAPDGLPEFRPGADLAGALADALTRDPHGLTDGDVVVLTSKVLSKTEGRIVAAPTDPEERDALRRGLVDSESVRVVARVNRTLITENRLGIVQAASGVDGSNV